MNPHAGRPPAIYAGRHRLRTRRRFIVEPCGLEPEQLARPLDWRTLFGNEGSVEIEIGAGRGTFLTEQAQLRPEVNFLGIEWSGAFWQFAADRLRRHGLANARVLRSEALHCLREFVPSTSVQALHVYFPDPWPKKRHHKRRLFQPPFLVEVERILLPGGRVQLATDHREYFEQIREVLAASTLRPAEFVPPPTASAGEIAGTNFERKYRRQGRGFYTLAAVR